MPKINNKYRRLCRLHVDVYAGLWDSPARWNEPDGRGEEKKCCEMGTEWQILPELGRASIRGWVWEKKTRGKIVINQNSESSSAASSQAELSKTFACVWFYIHHSILFTYHTVKYPLTPEVSSVFNFPHTRNVRHSSHNIHRHKTRNNITMSSPLQLGLHACTSRNTNRHRTWLISVKHKYPNCSSEAICWSFAIFTLSDIWKFVFTLRGVGLDLNWTFMRSPMDLAL